jgi:outer membrane lipoprotein LolB
MKAALLLAAVLALAGCAALRPPAGAVSWEERRARLLGLQEWQARGRIAVKAESGGGQGDLRWQQSGESSRIRLSGPFGAGAYEIERDPATLTVRSRDGEFSRAYSGPDAAEQFLAEQLGWSFPAASTRYWMLGVLDPSFAGEERLGTDGGLAGLSQNGWSVTYERFSEARGLPMPARLTLQSERARVRLIIDRWEIGPL